MQDPKKSFRIHNILDWHHHDVVPNLDPTLILMPIQIRILILSFNMLENHKYFDVFEFSYRFHTRCG
jgi:hypothetical protein